MPFKEIRACVSQVREECASRVCGAVYVRVVCEMMSCAGDLIKRAVERHGLGMHIPGIHLEGPMITSVGSHEPTLLKECSAENVRLYDEISEGFIRVITPPAPPLP